MLNFKIECGATGEIVIGERKYIEDIGSNINFIEIDDFINMSASHSFSET